MRKVIIISAAISILAVSACSPTEYEERWRSSPRADISKALYALGAKDCGAYKYKKELNSSEYYVRCETYDYLVFIGSGEALGPYSQDPSMN